MIARLATSGFAALGSRVPAAAAQEPFRRALV